MKTEEKFIGISCNVCKEIAGRDSDYSFFPLESDAIDNAKELDWYIHEDNHLCPDCHHFDENDNLIVKQVKP